MKKAGAERVSDESAADELRRVIEGIADGIAKSAVDMASHASRKTIKGEDVKLASKHLTNSNLKSLIVHFVFFKTVLWQNGYA